MIAVVSVLVAAAIAYLLLKRNPTTPDIYLEQPSSSSKQKNGIKCIDPSTDEIIGYYEEDTVETIKLKVQRARKAQKEYLNDPLFKQKRRLALQTLQKFILNNQEDIAAVCSKDTGKTFLDAFFGEILTTLEKIRWLLANGEQALKSEYRSTAGCLLVMNKIARVDYVPLGVVSAIVSWNYPFHNVYGPIVAALFAGNAIVLKPSEQTAWSSMNYFLPLIQKVLVACDCPVDMVQFVVGGPQVGEALITSGVDKVTFIGSDAVGRKVLAKAAESPLLCPVTLELGGKDAAVVCSSADMDQLIPIVMRGTYQNMGQNCVGLERVVLHDSLHEKFLKEVCERVDKMRIIEDFGAMTMGQKHIDRIQSLVDDAVACGAKLVKGGHQINITGKYAKGSYYAPTILTGVTESMKIAQQEVFGPIMTIMRFADDQEAIDICNSTPYALGFNIFSSNMIQAEYIVKNVRSGMANINDFGVSYLCQGLPFGGTKNSGFGRFAGVEGLRAECFVKAVTVDRISMFKTRVPAVLDYPIVKVPCQAFCTGLSYLAYGDLRQKAEGLLKIIAGK